MMYENPGREIHRMDALLAERQLLRLQALAVMEKDVSAENKMMSMTRLGERNAQIAKELSLEYGDLWKMREYTLYGINHRAIDA